MTTLADAISHLEAATTILRKLQQGHAGQQVSGMLLLPSYEESHPLGPAVANLSKKGQRLAAYVASQGGVVDYFEALSDLELAGICDSSRGLGGIIAGVTRNRWAALPPVLRLQSKGRNAWDIVLHPDYRDLDWQSIAD